MNNEINIPKNIKVLVIFVFVFLSTIMFNGWAALSGALRNREERLRRFSEFEKSFSSNQSNCDSKLSLVKHKDSNWSFASSSQYSKPSTVNKPQCNIIKNNFIPSS